MTHEHHLRDLQEQMSRARYNTPEHPLPELSGWITEVGRARDAAGRTTAALRTLTEVSDALNLLTSLLDGSHTEQISADQMRSLLEGVHLRLEGTLDDMRPLHL